MQCDILVQFNCTLKHLNFMVCKLYLNKWCRTNDNCLFIHVLYIATYFYILFTSIDFQWKYSILIKIFNLLYLFLLYSRFIYSYYSNKNYNNILMEHSQICMKGYNSVLKLKYQRAIHLLVFCWLIKNIWSLSK
jgi:uncharacterized membrane protein